MDESKTKLVALRINPKAWQIARIAAVTAQKTLGDWLQEAILEKAMREKEAESHVTKKHR